MMTRALALLLLVLAAAAKPSVEGRLEALSTKLEEHVKSVTVTGEPCPCQTPERTCPMLTRMLTLTCKGRATVGRRSVVRSTQTVLFQR